jgi:hypothetical protein
VSKLSKINCLTQFWNKILQPWEWRAKPIKHIYGGLHNSKNLASFPVYDLIRIAFLLLLSVCSTLLWMVQVRQICFEMFLQINGICVDAGVSSRRGKLHLVADRREHVHTVHGIEDNKPIQINSKTFFLFARKLKIPVNLYACVCKLYAMAM